MKPLLSMRSALEDPALFEPILGGDSWFAWRVMLLAMFGEELTRKERIEFERLTRRPIEPRQMVEVFVGIIGRRGGKSRAMAVAAAFIAALCDHSANVVPGERPLVLCLAQNQLQARVVFNYVAAIFDECPVLKGLVTNRTSDTLTLSNGIAIEVRAASFRGLRGLTTVAVLADETCFWRHEETSTNADAEIIAAVLPSLATTHGPMILISSPYAKRGETWNLYNRHFGPDGDPLILVAQGASRDFNPSLPERVVERALQADREAASAEYLGLWRNDVASFIDRTIIEAAVDHGVRVRSPVRGVRYEAFGDAASGTGKDSFTAAIAHAEGHLIVLDALYECRPPFNPNSAIAEIAGLLKSYGVSSIRGDRYSVGFVADGFGSQGIRYRYSERDRSAIYMEALPLLTAGRARLVDNDRLVSQFSGLERRTGPSGRDRVDHTADRHDDLSNAAAGALVEAAAPGASNRVMTVTPLLDLFGDRQKTRLEEKFAPEVLAARGFFHPSLRQFWIDKGVYVPPESEDTAP